MTPTKQSPETRARELGKRLAYLAQEKDFDALTTLITKADAFDILKSKAELKRMADHIQELHVFVEHIARYAEEPANWPLTHEEQIAFVRTVIFQARKIRDNEQYMAAAVRLAVEDLAMAT